MADALWVEAQRRLAHHFMLAMPSPQSRTQGTPLAESPISGSLGNQAKALEGLGNSGNGPNQPPSQCFGERLGKLSLAKLVSMDLAQLLEVGRWTTPPARWNLHNGVLDVEAQAGSDAWRSTSYGFIHDNAHALVIPLPDQAAIEVDFLADYSEQFDQAGLMLRENAENWIKAGVEVSDGALQLGAVVTRGASDWSVAPVSAWAGRVVTIRASRLGDAVTLRAKAPGQPWRLVRLAPIDPSAVVEAGPYCCSPTREGLEVRFKEIRFGAPDAALHPEG